MINWRKEMAYSRNFNQMSPRWYIVALRMQVKELRQH